MPYRAEDITYFFGAGASASFGIPTMKKMSQDFTKVIEGLDAPVERQLYGDIVDGLTGELGLDYVDIEAIMSVIEGLKNFSATNLGELSIFLVKKKLGHSLLSPELRPTREQLQAIPNLERLFQKFVRTQCRIKPEFRDHVGAVYKDFFSKIASISTSSTKHDDFSFSNWTMFTTNYDRCIEYFWRDYMEMPLYTGFTSQPGTIHEVLRPETFRLPSDRVQLVKIHGSTTWLKNRKSQRIIEERFDVDQAAEVGVSSKYDEEVMIYPLAEKELYLYPYLPMFDSLNKYLASKRIFIVVGYSFRDSVIRHIFSDYLSNDKKMVLVHPDAEKIVREQFPNHVEKIVQVSDYFGQKDTYENVNQNITQSLHQATQNW